MCVKKTFGLCVKREQEEFELTRIDQYVMMHIVAECGYIKLVIYRNAVTSKLIKNE